MKLLVDTNVLLWLANDPSRIANATLKTMQDGANELLVSVISAWEIAVKQSIGKLKLPGPAEEWLPEMLERSGLRAVEPGLAAALRVRTLPWHHRDPFDRLLIAHAMEDGYTIVTRDRAFGAYDVPVLAA
jgi:PIN domain nuclease of toxin-antitoxin system